MSDAPVPARLLDAALAAARRERLRLDARRRGLFAAATGSVVLVGLRGLVAIGWPASHGAPLLACGLAIVLVASAVLFLLALRASRRMDLLTRHVLTLELARDALDQEAAPHVDVHPYRELCGEEESLVVVRTDSVERSFDEKVPRDVRRRPTLFARTAASIVVLGALLLGAIAFVEGDSPARHRWTFLDETTDPGAIGFRLGVGRGGSWTLEQQETATGARALVNHVGDRSAPPAMLLASSVRARDLKASTRCKVAAAPGGDACGIAFRVFDDRNHSIARLDVVGRRVVVAVVRGGVERVLGAADARVEPGVWQELSLEARGDRIRISCNGRDVIDVADPVPAHFGSVGLWAPAAAEVHFDDFAVEVLPASAQALEVAPLLRKGTSS